MPIGPNDVSVERVKRLCAQIDRMLISIGIPIDIWIIGSFEWSTLPEFKNERPSPEDREVLERLYTKAGWTSFKVSCTKVWYGYLSPTASESDAFQFKKRVDVWDQYGSS
jgi:hypothetical protein